VTTRPATPLVRTRTETPFGRLTLVASEAGLRAVLWPDDRPSRVRLAGDVHDLDAAEDPVLAAAAEQLDAYAGGERSGFDLPLDLAGTPFQRAVWAGLGALPYGTTCTYGELAARVATPVAVRAVAGAVGRNPVSIVLPCHRVLGSDGRLTGFAGGLDVKRRLLDHERAHARP
jgi:methylated-DNA-[protein]-cysteine S-methyltransferase